MSGVKELRDMLAALPHAEPFRFVSELTALEPLGSGSGVWIVSGQEAFFAGHFPGAPIVPGVLIAESLAQLCGLVAFGGAGTNGVPGQPARLAQIDVKILAAVRPPARLELAAKLVRDLGRLVMFDVNASVGGVPAAEGRIVLAKVS